MDISQNSPIVIHSDDEDDDDDVLLVKTEEAPDGAKKKEEDDVIFISEEPSTSIQKCTSENKKNKRKVIRRLSSSSTSDDDSSCAIPQLRYFRSEFSSVSLVDDILRPLDLSQTTVQTTEVLPSVITHKLSPVLKPVQTACSSADAVVFQEQGESTPDKAVEDIEINPVKILHDFGLSSGKSIDNTFGGRSIRVDRFAPLKLPEGAEPLSSQTLNTPICKIDPGKECFNLCSQDGKDANPTARNVFDDSTSSHPCTGITPSAKEKQEVSGSLCSSSAKWENTPGKLAIGTYVSNTNLAQDIDVNSSCDDRAVEFTSDLLTPLPAAQSELDKDVTSLLDQSLDTPDDVNSSSCSVLVSTNTYLTEVNSRPGTSKQFSNLNGPHVSQPPSDTAKLHVPRSKVSPNGSPITLDFNNLCSEDFNSLLDILSDEADLVLTDSRTDPISHANEPGQSLKGNNKIELTNPTYDNPANVCSPKTPSISGHSSSLTSVSEDLLTESDPQMLNSNNSLLSSRHCSSSPVVTGYRDTSEKSSIPTVLSSKRRANNLKTSQAIKRRYSAYILHRKKASNPHPWCLSSSQLTMGAAVNCFKSKRCTKYRILQVRRYSKRQSNGVFANLIKKQTRRISLASASLGTGVKVGKNDPAQWRIVSLEPIEKKRGSRDSNLNDKLPLAKRRKITEDSTREKPGLKIRLKLSAVASGQIPHSGTSVQTQPAYSGLKKSIIRRHASVAGDPLVKGVQIHTNLHRSTSEYSLKKQKTEGSDIQMLCVTCEKSVTSTRLSKCSKGHGVCTTCLEAQVKAILTGVVKQKNIRCPASSCIEIVSFDELKRALPPFVVDILEEKLDKEYLSYITKWMFTDEQLKTRSEFATSDTRMPPCPALSMRKYEEIYTQESRDPTEDLPTFWTPMERGAPVMVFEVVPDTEEYRALALQFHETLNFGDFDIVRIIRVQNPILWKYFALKRSEMVQENDGMDVTEKQLYHGTHRSTLEAIARKGFDWRLSGKHGTVYGCGSYFAKTSRYSHGYTDRAGNGISVKSGSIPGRIIQPNLGLASLGMGFASSAYLSRIHSRVQTFFNLPQPSLMPLMPLPPVITSQNQPPQPPPAHYHLPTPPPAHGQMSSLQVPAHNQTFNPVINKGTTIGGPSAGPCAVTTSNLPFVKILSVASTSSSLPVVPGPPVPRSTFIQPKFSSYHACLNSSKTLYSEQLCKSLDFQSGPQTSFTALDSHFSSVSLCPTQTVSFQTQSSLAGSRKVYASPSTSVCKMGLSTSSGMSVFPAGDILGSSNSQTKFVAGSSSSIATKGQTENKHTSLSTSTKLRAHERGTADLTTSFARDTNSETHFMFVARVLVGRHTGGKAGLKRPPPLDENNPFGKSYDSCVDDIFYPQVFVIFDSNQAYPEYVIEYSWHKD